MLQWPKSAGSQPSPRGQGHPGSPEHDSHRLILPAALLACPAADAVGRKAISFFIYRGYPAISSLKRCPPHPLRVWGACPNHTRYVGKQGKPRLQSGAGSAASTEAVNSLLPTRLKRPGSIYSSCVFSCCEERRRRRREKEHLCAAGERALGTR